MGSQTFRTSPTCRTCLTRPRANTDSCSFASFVNIRGLKTSIEFPLFSSHEALQSSHERERTNNSAFLRVDFLIASASTIRMSADRIRKSADTIRKPADTIRVFLALLIVLEIRSVRGSIFSLGEWIASRRIVLKVGKGERLLLCVFTAVYIFLLFSLCNLWNSLYLWPI